MPRYGASFQMTDEMVVLFYTMGEGKVRWMRDYSILVDCMYAALSYLEGTNTQNNRNIPTVKQQTFLRQPDPSSQCLRC